MIRYKSVLMILIVLIILVSIANIQGCKQTDDISKNRYLSKDVIVLLRKNKLIVRNNSLKKEKIFNITNIQSLQMSPSGKKIAYFTETSTAKKTKNPIMDFILYLSSRKELNILDLKTGQIKRKVMRIIPISMKWSADSKYLYLTAGDISENIVHVINTNNGKLEYKLNQQSNDYFRSAFLNPDTYIVASWDGYIWTLKIAKSGKIIKRIDNVEYAALGKNLLILNDLKLQILNGKNIKLIKSLKLPDNHQYRFQVSPNGKVIVLFVDANDKKYNPKYCFDDGYFFNHVRFYDSKLKLLYKTKENLEEVRFKDDENIYFFNKIKKRKKAIYYGYSVLNIKTKRQKYLGEYQLIDWLTESNVKERILYLPKKGVKKIKSTL